MIHFLVFLSLLKDKNTKKFFCATLAVPCVLSCVCVLKEVETIGERDSRIQYEVFQDERKHDMQPHVTHTLTTHGSPSFSHPRFELMPPAGIEAPH